MTMAPMVPGRQKLSLVAITAFDVVHATILADQLPKCNPRQPGNSRFHTVCLVFERESDVPKLLINATRQALCRTTWRYGKPS